MLKDRIARTALVGVLGLFTALSAHAADYSLGTLSPVPITGLNPVSNNFTDYLNFTIAAPDTFAYAVVQNFPVSYTIPGTNIDVSVSNINNLMATLYNGFDAGGSAVSGLTSTNTSFSGNLTAGNYSLELTGTGTGSSGFGEYSYAAAAIAPVPEPAESTLMAVGFAMVGFVAVSKKRRV